MKINLYDNPEQFPYIVVDDVYDEKELGLIWTELDFLCYDDKLFDPMQAGSAMESDNGKEWKSKKKNRSIFLDGLYSRRSVSDILTLNRKTFNIVREVRDQKQGSWWIKNLKTDNDTTMVSYYEDSDYYSSHFDNAVFTALTWFYREPKRFEGGNLRFTEYNLDIECKTNRAVIFPSSIYHKVHKVIMEEEYRGKKLGRWCMTQFGSMIDEFALQKDGSVIPMPLN